MSEASSTVPTADADTLRHCLPPRSTADRDRFFEDVERACRERDDSVNDVIFESFYTFYPQEG